MHGLSWAKDQESLSVKILLCVNLGSFTKEKQAKLLSVVLANKKLHMAGMKSE